MAKIEIEDTELAALRRDIEKYKTQVDVVGQQKSVIEAALAKAKTDGEAAVARVTAEFQRGAVFDKAQITDPKVRRLFELEFEEQSATEAGKKDMGEWLGALAQDANAPAILKPFLVAPTNPAPGAGGAPANPAKPPPNVNGGAQQLGGAPTTFTAESIAAMNPAELRAAWPALQKQFPDLSGFPLPGQTGQA